MNAIELFKKGRKVKTRAGNLVKGSFVKLKGEDFWRRVNSDGTLTIVGNKKGLYNYLNAPSKVRNHFILSNGGIHGNVGDHWSDKLVYLVENMNPSNRIVNDFLDLSGLLSKILNSILRNTEGSASPLEEAVSIITAPLRNNYYDGKLHDNKLKKSNGLWNAVNKWSNNFKDDNRNLINLYTLRKDKGFSPSKLGTGIYKNHQEYSKYPAYEGNYYNVDTLYLPSESKQYFTSNINNRYVLDHDILIKGMKSVEGLDDVRNYQMTPRLIDGLYYVDMEDVWNLDRAGFDSRNYPFILNLRIPVVFTNNENKLNITPELSKWFAVPGNWNKN